MRSFKVLIDELHSFFHNVNFYPHILAITEAWLTETNSEHIPGFLSYHSVRLGGRLGGVSLLWALIQFRTSASEIMILIYTVKVDVTNCQTIIAGIYRPYNGTVETFMNYLRNSVNTLHSNHERFMKLSDLRISCCSKVRELKNWNKKYGFLYIFQYITTPTRLMSKTNQSPLNDIWLSTTRIINYVTISFLYNTLIICLAS